MLNSYFSVHNHTDYSNAALGFSDCINKTETLIQYAYDIGLNGVCITDHECISSYIQALNYYDKMQKERPFTLGLGNECYLLSKDEYESNLNGESNIPFYHFILLALDTEGYHQICKLSTRAWERAWFKGVWRRPTLYEDLEEIIKPNQGHVIASTACLGSRLDRLLLDGDFKGADAEIERLVEIFGEGNLYIECQPAQEKENGTDQSRVNPMLWAMAVHHNLPIIPTTDSHYLRKEDALIHKVFLQSQDGEREVDDFYATAYMMSADELKKYLQINFNNEQINTMYQWSNQLGERIKGYDIKHNPIIPQLPIEKIPSFKIGHFFKEYYLTHPNFAFYSNRDEIHESYFFYQVEQGLLTKVVNKGKPVDQYIDRLELEWDELKKISEALGNSMVSYYSTMAELIDLMWGVGSFVGAGRGSSAGFLTTYLLDITQVDPVPLGDYLPYWRHVALERGAEIADIDTDSEPCKKYAIIDAVKEYFGEDRVLNVATFGEVSSKTAIERACRGLGINDDVAGYLKSLIPVNRGKIANLKDCLYGENKLSGLKAEFNKYRNLEECALGICGVICQRGLHAAGLCISNEPYVNYLSAMKAPNGTMCTSFNLWDSEAVSLVKFDLLTVEALQKMHKTMDAMLEDGVIEWQGSVRDTYNKYFHPDNIDYTTPEMWDSITKMYSCFQWETPIGVKAIGQIKPQNIMDLSAGNSLIRLMPEGREETPLDTYVRYKEHPEQWEEEATAYGLNEEEKQVIREYCEDAHYLADCQEKIMRLSQDKRIAGYGLKDSNKLRKAIAKKDEKLQAEAKEKFFECGKQQGTREVFLHYVWDVLFSASFGYSFSSIHSYVYSIIALQELNMFYHYNPIYWNVGCLRSETSSDEEGSGGTIDYSKISKAIQKMSSHGIIVKAPSVNYSQLDFTPYVKENSILFGISGISGINAAIAQQIISNRPYSTFDDFYNKNSYQGSLVTNSKFIQLIKAGCFDEFCQDRIKVMKRYIFLSTPQKESLTSANLSKALSMGVEIPRLLLSPYNFKSYVCSKQFLYGSHPKFKSKKLYWLDRKALRYFEKNCKDGLTEGVDWWYDSDSDKTIVVDKSLEKILSPALNELKAYLTTSECVKDYNKKLMREAYEEAIDGVEDVNKWSFDACSYFSQEHQLANVDLDRYSITPFEELPEEPKFTIKSARGREWRQFEIARIAGVVLAKNDNHHYITILDAHNNVVNCNFDANSYAFYKQQLSEIEADGSKTVVEKPWIKRGEALILTGYRYNQSDFKIKTYKSSIYQHKVQRITKVNRDGSMEIQSVRYGYEEN